MSADKEITIDPVADFYNRLTPADTERFKDKTMEEILLLMATDNSPVIANAIIRGAMTADPAALKILQNIMDRQGGALIKELPISNEQFKKIIIIASKELLNV